LIKREDLRGERSRLAQAAARVGGRLGDLPAAPGSRRRGRRASRSLLASCTSRAHARDDSRISSRHGARPARPLSRVTRFDVHSVAAVDRLRALTRGDLAHELPFVSRRGEAPRRCRSSWPSCCTTSARAAAKDTASAVRRWRAPSRPASVSRPSTSTTSSWLVQEHSPSITGDASRHERSGDHRGGGAPRRFGGSAAGSVSTHRRRFSTTKPQAMTSWKARMLDDLYIASHKRSRAARLRHPTSERRIRADLRVRLVGLAGRRRSAPGPTARARALRAFVDEMPARYVLANPPEAISPTRASLPRAVTSACTSRCCGAAGELAELVVVTTIGPGCSPISRRPSPRIAWQ